MEKRRLMATIERTFNDLMPSLSGRFLVTPPISTKPQSYHNRLKLSIVKLAHTTIGPVVRMKVVELV